MAYIAPNSTIIVCNGVPIDKDYTHTVKFANASEQHTGIISYAKYTFTAQSYQRYDKNTLRITVNPDNIYDCNYLCFQNASFGNKWFYAFIDSVEYINNVTAEVRYTIDVMQTYLFDYNISYCYVVREHSATDEIGDNLVPENIATGDLICHYESRKVYLNNDMYTVIMYIPNYKTDGSSTTWVKNEDGVPVATTTAPSEQYIPSIRNKFYGGICCLAFHNDNMHALDISVAVAMIDGLGGKVVSCFDIPAEIYNDNFNANGTLKRTFNINERNAFVYARNPNEVYSNVRNKKLLQYPYKRLIVSNGNGMNSEYNWELFSTRNGENVQAQFEIINGLLPDPTIITYPLNYRGKMLDNADYENRCTIKDFPRQCYTEDSYSQWCAQNNRAFSTSTIASFMGTLFSGFGSIMGGSGKAALGAGFRMIGNISDTVGNAMAAKQKAQDTPDSVNVQDNTAIINLLNDCFGFTFYDIGVTGEMAEVIDDYFDMYGYATNRVKVPNFVGNGARPIWNYIKTDNLTINGERLPAEAEREICDIYNNGITFWDTLAHVGNYNLNNRPNGQ